MSEQRTEPHGDESADLDEEHPNEHDHDGEALGPIDSTAWAAGVVGVALGLVVALCFVLATGGVG
jgi:hypothetical protein